MSALRNRGNTSKDGSTSNIQRHDYDSRSPWEQATKGYFKSRTTNQSPILGSDRSHNSHHQNYISVKSFDGNDVSSPENDLMFEPISKVLAKYNKGNPAVGREELTGFIDTFCDRMEKRIAMSSYKLNSNGNLIVTDPFSCLMCYGVMSEPVTMTCGHSYCRKCIQKDGCGSTCKMCNYVFTHHDLSNMHPNVLISTLIDKWWPKASKTISLRNEGNSLFSQNKCAQAVDRYTEALKLSPDDHLSLGNRSNAFLSLGCNEAAFEDAKKAIECCPFWAKGYFRQGVALVTLGQYEPAFTSLVLCAFLVKANGRRDQGGLNSIKQEMTKVLHKICIQNKKGNSSRLRKLFEHGIGELNKLQAQLVTRLSHLSQDENRSYPLEWLRNVDKEVVLVGDFECTLCYRILHEPVSTMCGHTYCRSCLERSLDHSSLCPLCKTSLQQFLSTRRYIVTEFLVVALSNLLTKEYEERNRQHLEELAADQDNTENEGGSEIPIFVCTMAFPTIPCPLHVFEPRYRLMIRRSIESGAKKFGMCCYLADSDQNFADVGTILKINYVQYLADGRSILDTVGDGRFRVLSKSLKDGYYVAQVQIIRDRLVEPSETEKLKSQHDEVYKEAENWLKSISPVVMQRIQTHFGSMPMVESNWLESPDGPSWMWWLLAVLPLETKAQLAIIKLDSVQERLESLHKVLRFVRSSKFRGD